MTFHIYKVESNKLHLRGGAWMPGDAEAICKKLAANGGEYVVVQGSVVN